MDNRKNNFIFEISSISSQLLLFFLVRLYIERINEKWTKWMFLLYLKKILIFLIFLKIFQKFGFQDACKNLRFHLFQPVVDRIYNSLFAIIAVKLGFSVAAPRLMWIEKPWNRRTKYWPNIDQILTRITGSSINIIWIRALIGYHLDQFARRLLNRII